jgi:hypothetical protein
MYDFDPRWPDDPRDDDRDRDLIPARPEDRSSLLSTAKLRT